MKPSLSMIFVLLILLAGCALEGQPNAFETETETQPLNTVTKTDRADSQGGEANTQAVVEPIEPIEPIEVTYFTPSQGEGPYYPVEKLADRDNDLTDLAGATAAPVGDVLEFGGKLYDATGFPVAGAVIEIWQTDDHGVYLHPNDPGTGRRDVNFQFYGEATTAADGSYTFRTIMPGRYEPRPRHIHVKVKWDGQELLTTQFYFANDPALVNEQMFTQEGSDAVHMVMDLIEGQDAAGNSILIGQRDIILRGALASP